MKLNHSLAILATGGCQFSDSDTVGTICPSQDDTITAIIPSASTNPSIPPKLALDLELNSHLCASSSDPPAGVSEITKMILGIRRDCEKQIEGERAARKKEQEEERAARKKEQEEERAARKREYEKERMILEEMLRKEQTAREKLEKQQKTSRATFAKTLKERHSKREQALFKWKNRWEREREADREQWERRISELQENVSRLDREKVHLYEALQGQMAESLAATEDFVIMGVRHSTILRQC
jgi:primosomal protein N'